MGLGGQPTDLTMFELNTNNHLVGSIIRKLTVIVQDFFEYLFPIRETIPRIVIARECQIQV